MTALAQAEVGTAEAAREGERTIAAGVATVRAGALLILAASLLSESWHGTRAVWLALLATVVVAESVAVVVPCLVTGRVVRRWAALDVAVLVALVALSAAPGFLPGRPGLSPL